MGAIRDRNKDKMKTATYELGDGHLKQTENDPGSRAPVDERTAIRFAVNENMHC